jgi:hypothetical protein
MNRCRDMAVAVAHDLVTSPNSYICIRSITAN